MALSRRLPSPSMGSWTSAVQEAPFTNYAPAGPEALINGADIEALVRLLDGVRAAATPGVA